METKEFKSGEVYNISNLNPNQQETLRNGKLFYLQTQTIEQFKQEQLVDKVQVKKNEKTSKLFFTYGANVGSVAAQGIPANPMISKVLGNAKDQDGTVIPGKASCFYLLHNEAAGGAPVIAEF